MELLAFILIAYGLTQIIVYGKIFDRLRPKKGMMRKLFECPMCVGFHVGWFLLLLSPFTELFNFDITLINFFLLGCLSSGTSYVLNMVFGDSGIQHTQKMELENNEHHLDTEMDASTSTELQEGMHTHAGDARIEE